MPEVLKRPAPKPISTDDSALRDRVRTITDDIRTRGDTAVRECSERFDGWSHESFRLTPDEIERIVATVPEQALDDIRFVQAQVRTFAEHQREPLRDYGDKGIGTNHALPTKGAAWYTGGLWVGKYLKTVTYQEVTDPATSAALGEVCGRAARVELFEGHARSGDVRAAKYGDATLEWTGYVPA